MTRHFSIWISATAVAACASSQPNAPCPRVPTPTVAETKTESKSEIKAPRAEVVSLDAGVLVYDISISDTAQIFHIADQLSGWSPFMHPQYMRWAEQEHLLGSSQKMALAAHQAVRKRLHYGVLDQNFYTTKSVQDALIGAKTMLSAEDLEVEKNLFETMTPVIAPFIEQHRAEVVALRDRILSEQDKHYALYPGIVGKRGSIDRTLAQFASSGKLVDDPCVRFHRLGKRLTPLLEKALIEKTTLATLLPAACTEWKKVVAEPWPPK